MATRILEATEALRIYERARRVGCTAEHARNQAVAYLFVRFPADPSLDLHTTPREATPLTARPGPVAAGSAPIRGLRHRRGFEAKGREGPKRRRRPSDA